MPHKVTQHEPRRFRLWLILLAFSLVSCHNQEQQHSASFLVFGTVVDVTLRGVDYERAEAAFGDLQALFQELHHEWHPWQQGALMALNEHIAQGRAYQVPARLAELIEHAQTAERESCGLFNAASGELIHLWGFHTSQFPIEGPPPSQEQIHRVVQHRPSTLALHVENNRISSDNPNLRLDLSGLAKGAAVALAIDKLHARGIPAALVNAGGDLMAYQSAQSTPWRVAIRDPFNAENGVLAQVTVQGSEAVFTSGNYARYRQDQQQRYAHILDPRNGWPVVHIAAATVIHEQAWRADAAATALMIAGNDEPWQQIAARMGVEKALIVRQDGRIEATPAMAKRLQGESWQPRVAQIAAFSGAESGTISGTAPYAHKARHLWDETGCEAFAVKAE